LNALKLSRVLILLTILLIVAVSQWRGEARLADWQRPLQLTVYPLLVDLSGPEAGYARSLSAADFAPVGDFLAREARRYGVDSAPTLIQLAAPAVALPPPVPAGDSRLAIALWSLRMRWWAWRRAMSDGLPDGDVQIFVQFHPVSAELVLDRSVGIRKGRYSVVNAFASLEMQRRNNVVVAHELLHVLGATDKYDPASRLPLAPHGLGEPDRRPLFPQRYAEIMAGAVALAPARARMPASLDQCLVGPVTAVEIGLLDAP
jgi:hypothetical protein